MLVEDKHQAENFYPEELKENTLRSHSVIHYLVLDLYACHLKSSDIPME